MVGDRRTVLGLSGLTPPTASRMVTLDKAGHSVHERDLTCLVLYATGAVCIMVTLLRTSPNNDNWIYTCYQELVLRVIFPVHRTPKSRVIGL